MLFDIGDLKNIIKHFLDFHTLFLNGILMRALMGYCLLIQANFRAILIKLRLT